LSITAIVQRTVALAGRGISQQLAAAGFSFGTSTAASLWVLYCIRRTSIDALAVVVSDGSEFEASQERGAFLVLASTSEFLSDGLAKDGTTSSHLQGRRRSKDGSWDLGVVDGDLCYRREVPEVVVGVVNDSGIKSHLVEVRITAALEVENQDVLLGEVFGKDEFSGVFNITGINVKHRIVPGRRESKSFAS
jgi:hypothetical protein